MSVDELDIVWRLALTLGLSSAIGLERELSQKSAGLRTYTLVGLGSALFMIISKYGFFDVLEPKTVVLDPSRVAAQIVSGIGFIGAGLIFVRRDSVRGLTTAAGVWLTAAIGAAAACRGHHGRLLSRCLRPGAARSPAARLPLCALRRAGRLRGRSWSPSPGARHEYGP